MSCAMLGVIRPSAHPPVGLRAASSNSAISFVRRFKHRQEIEVNATKIEHGAYLSCEMFSRPQVSAHLP
jgi:hypothetical protein